MILKRDKLYQNRYIDLRSYEIETAIKNNEPITILHNGEQMDLSVADLKTKKLLLNKTPIQSKVNPNQTYLLFSFLWRANKKLTPDEELAKLVSQVVC